MQALLKSLLLSLSSIQRFERYGLKLNYDYSSQKSFQFPNIPIDYHRSIPIGKTHPPKKKFPNKHLRQPSHRDPQHPLYLLFICHKMCQKKNDNVHFQRNIPF